MTIITKGMGAIIKGLKKANKKLSPPYKTDIPFYATVGAVVAGKTVYEIAKEKSKKKKKDKDKE